MKLNPKILSWVAPTKNVDGSAFGAADLAGYTFAHVINGVTTEVVSLPIAYATTSIPFAELTLPQNVEFLIAARTNAKNGESSEWAVFPEALKFDTRRPLAPSAVAVA
jgi:hypothetical protein